MDSSTFANLGTTINHRFSDAGLSAWGVSENQDGIFLAKWDEEEMGESKPDEKTMLTWVKEFEALSDYDKLTPAAKQKADALVALKASVNSDTLNLLKYLDLI